MGFRVALWGVLETIASLIIREEYLEYRSGPLTPPQTGSGPEDEKILAIVQEVQTRIKRPEFGLIATVARSDYQPWYWAGFKRQGIRKPFTIL